MRADTLPQPRGHGLQNLVSHPMTQRLVHRSEAVDVDGEHRDIEPLRACIGDDVIEKLQKEPAARQAGQVVGVRAGRTGSCHSPVKMARPPAYWHRARWYDSVFRIES